MASPSQIVIRPAARRDILEAFDYLSREGGARTADRFVSGVESAARLLAERPRIGRVCGFSGRISRRFRQWPVPGFEDWLIYIPYRNTVELLRVLHGARDLAAILE